MSQTLPPDLLSRARQILLPLVTTEADREALLTEAFYLHDPLLYTIDRQGAPYPFAVNCVRRLLDYGCLTAQEHSLARLLAIARTLYGMDKHAEIDDLIEIVNVICQASGHATRQTVLLTPPADPAPLQTVATPRAERRPTVFLSYAHADADFASKLIEDLRAAGHACWIDTSSLKGGDEWITTIAEGIINSYVMVVVVTPAALQSRWVQDEILWARQKKKPIIPVMLEKLFDETGFFPLTSYQAETFFDKEYDVALGRLLRALPGPTLPEISSEEVTDAESPASAVSPVSHSQLPHSVPRTLELAYLERLKLEELLSTEKYTPLGGSSQQHIKRTEMRTVFELLPMGKGREEFQERRRFENAVTEIRRLRRAVLLGEPGGGKTTTIWKLTADLVADALTDPSAPIPLLIRLGRWTDAKQTLRDFIASQLGDLGAYLDVLLNEKRAALLLDGLNEMPASQHADKYPLVQRFIEQHPQLLAVASCRELDYTIDLEFNRINITPLDPLRIREFVGRYLGEARGETLFWRIAGGDKVRAVQEVWQKAGASFDMFWTASDIPSENPDVYSATTSEQDQIWQEKVRGKHSLMELARNPYMLLMLTSVYNKYEKLPDNRGDLFRQFVEELLDRECRKLTDETQREALRQEQAVLIDRLARVAFEMQMRRSPDERGNALTVLPKDDVRDYLSERQLYLAGSASILSVGEQVRFTHQLLQEYFAAQCMDSKIRNHELVVTDIWPADRWWQRTSWEEAAILLAGLYSDDCTPIIDWVARGNPEAAAQCIVRSGASLAEATREQLRTEWIPLLTDLQRNPQPQARAAIGRALDLTSLDNRKGVSTVQQADGVILPDIDFVGIPGGPFQYGDNSEYAAAPQRLTLPTFYISRYPITFAQFQTFLDDPAGMSDARWFAGLAADAGEWQIQEQQFKFANHPRETVNWYQALAFCRWLSWRWGGSLDLKKIDDWAVRLPTEYEWEKAARGTDGRLYPSGNEFDALKGNTHDTGIGQTSAVGIFPQGASPYGVEEMSGNVWEWCLSDYSDPQIEPRKENLRSQEDRVLRGGSWLSDQLLARAVSRNDSHPADRAINGGFRVVVRRPPSSV